MLIELVAILASYFALVLANGVPHTSLKHSTYERIFNQIAEELGSVATEINDHVILPESGFVAVAVGPPGRGKSTTFQILKEYAADRNVAAVQHNAGDIRRIFERACTAKSEREMGWPFFLHIASNLDGTDEDVRRWISEWLDNVSDAMINIPAELYASPLGRRLNNYFAAVALQKIFSDSSETIHYLDATNTAPSRRRLILEMAIKFRKPVLFIENMCVNENTLFLNFLAKIFTSGDYRNVVVNHCPKEQVVDVKQWNDVNIFNYPRHIASHVDNKECQAIILETMSDIVYRDSVYLEKYVPMHISTTEEPSTISLIDDTSHRRTGIPAAYLQVMVSACTKDGQSDPVIHSNFRLGDNQLIGKLSQLKLREDMAGNDSYKGRRDEYYTDDLMQPELLARDRSGPIEKLINS